MKELLRRLSIMSCSTLFLCSAIPSAQAQDGRNAAQIPPDIKAILDRPFYHGAIWGLRVIDLDSGRPVMDIEPNRNFFIGSVRKVFTVGELMDEVGPAHRYNTPVYRQGVVNDRGVLRGDLILVASGDLTMGGRTNPDGSREAPAGPRPCASSYLLSPAAPCDNPNTRRALE